MSKEQLVLKPSLVASSPVRASQVKPKEKSWASAVSKFIK